jgi:hypothetical protein
MTTTSLGGAMRLHNGRRTSRRTRFTRLRTTAFPTRVLTVIPMRLCGPPGAFRTTKCSVCRRLPSRWTRRKSLRFRRRATLGNVARDPMLTLAASGESSSSVAFGPLLDVASGPSVPSASPSGREIRESAFAADCSADTFFSLAHRATSATGTETTASAKSQCNRRRAPAPLRCAAPAAFRRARA